MENLSKEPTKDHKTRQAEVHSLVALLPEVMNQGKGIAQDSSVEKSIEELLKKINSLKLANGADQTAPKLEYYGEIANSAIRSAKGAGNNGLALNIETVLHGMKPIGQRGSSLFSEQHSKRKPLVPDGTTSLRA